MKLAVGWITRAISEMDGMDVDLALFVVDSEHQELGVNVNFMWIPAQAVEQIIKMQNDVYLHCPSAGLGVLTPKSQGRSCLSWLQDEPKHPKDNDFYEFY